MVEECVLNMYNLPDKDVYAPPSKTTDESLIVNKLWSRVVDLGRVQVMHLSLQARYGQATGDHI